MSGGRVFWEENVFCVRSAIAETKKLALVELPTKLLPILLPLALSAVKFRPIDDRPW
jgi:hypothetical protein